MVKAKEGEITSPLITAVLAARVVNNINMNQLFPGNARPLQFTERELKVVHQALVLATRMLQERGV